MKRIIYGLCLYSVFIGLANAATPSNFDGKTAAGTNNASTPLACVVLADSSVQIVNMQTLASSQAFSGSSGWASCSIP